METGILYAITLFPEQHRVMPLLKKAISLDMNDHQLEHTTDPTNQTPSSVLHGTTDFAIEFSYLMLSFQ